MSSTKNPAEFGRVRKLMRIVVAIAIAIAVVVGLVLAGRRSDWGELANELEAGIRGLGVWGPAVFGATYVLAVVAMAPASALTLVGGAMFGPVVGTVVVSIASTTGAALAFLIARAFARDAVAERIRRSPRFEAIDRAVGERGWKIVALLRLSPAVPFNIQNYLYGLTSIRFWPCVLVSWVAMLPGTVMYATLGHLGRTSLDSASGRRTRTPAEWAISALGLAATVVVTMYVARIARNALNRSDPGSNQTANEPIE